jgi:hypothetical protein
LFISQLRFLYITPLSDEPFWSLAYEFWYYVILGAVQHLRGRVQGVGVTVAALVARPDTCKVEHASSGSRRCAPAAWKKMPTRGLPPVCWPI